jgi:hypothetical protein
MTGKRRKGRDPVIPPQPPSPEPPDDALVSDGEDATASEAAGTSATSEVQDASTPEAEAEQAPDADAEQAPEVETDQASEADIDHAPEPAPAAVEPVATPRMSRRQARIARKRQQRRRIGMVGGSAIAAGVLVIAGIGAFVGDKVATSGHNPGQDQTTVLFQLQAPDRTASASALLAYDSTNGQGLEVLVPSRLITDVCGYSTQKFGSVLALPGGDAASRQTLSMVLGDATVDGSWILQPSQLGKLIDLEGGITTDVDVDVVQHTAGGGGNVLVQSGANEELNGSQAVRYATYSTSATADASNQLARLQQVIDATAAALPPTTTRVEAMLRQLGPGGGSTIGVARLADFLVGFAAAERATGKLLPTDLPISLIDAGGAPSYRVDVPRTQALVANSLSKSVPADAKGDHPTVELLNGVGSPGLVATACPRLAANGLTYAGSQNAPSFNNPRSTIEVSTSNIDIGYQVASALQLPRSDVRRSTVQQSVADAIVTLGGDYRP